MIKLLSYYIDSTTPLYGDSKGISFTKEKEIINGDSCNTMNLEFPNHCGTHIDLPCHFNLGGESLSDYPASYWEFNNIDLIDLSGQVNDGEIIGTELFTNYKNSKTELLLIKTGYGKYRGTKKYTLTPPGLSSDLSSLFRANFPKLRCIGMDLISISSYVNREEGRKAHHAFLNPQNGKPILLIEDMKLEYTGPFRKIIVAPLLIDKADGAPCTIFGYLN